MAIIDPAGLFHGRRLRLCKSGARLRWPHYFLGSNGFGRLRLDPYEVITTIFPEYHPPITVDVFMEDMREYKANFLLFVYKHQREVWGQWDTPDSALPRYKNAKDRTSPAPDPQAFQKWRSEYLKKFTSPASGLLELARTFPRNGDLFLDSPNLDVENELFAETFRESSVFAAGEERSGEERSGLEGKFSQPSIKKQEPAAAAAAAAAPPLPKNIVPPLSTGDWEQPDPSQLASELANELCPLHWIASSIPFGKAHVEHEFTNPVNNGLSPSEICENIRIAHEKARSIQRPKSIANKQFCYWVADGAWRFQDSASPQDSSVSSGKTAGLNKWLADQEQDRLRQEAERKGTKHGK
jgi:hypothetical protein